ncbi:ankyrin repeat domain-containing protein 40-like [Branchiostoma floridae x Branchiostoma belcheri]
MMNQFQGEEMMEIEQKGRITFQDLVLMVRIVIQNLQNGIMITAATNVYVDGSKLTRDQLLRACCEALGVHPCNVRLLSKAFNIIIATDNDIGCLRNNDDVVLYL